MKNNYFETEKQIYSLVRQYGEFVVKNALSNLMRVGSETLTEEYVEKQKNKITEQHEIFKAQGEIPLVSAEVESNIVDVAFELSKLNNFHIFAYMQEKLFFDVEQNAIPKERMKILLLNVISVLRENFSNNFGFIGTLMDECDFNDDEIEKLGFNEQLKEYIDKLF